jgi:hypothetical protein
MIKRFYYGPPEWLVTHWNAKDRRAFAFWSFWLAVALSFPFGRQVLWVTVLSLLALISTFTSETPVEEE